jgi:hypothetical protein
MGFADTKANAGSLLDPTIENSSRFRAPLRKCGFQSTELNQAKPDRSTRLCWGFFAVSRECLV